MTDDAWYLTIRRYLASGSPEAIGRRVREGLLPTLARTPAFRAYHTARMDGGSGVFAVAVLADRNAMLVANACTMAWVKPALGALLTTEPEVTTVAVTVHLDATRQGHDSYVLFRMTEGLGPFSTVLPAVQERLVPLTLEQPRFRHFYSGRDEARSDLAVGASVFSDRSTATAVHAQVAALIAQHRDLWPKPTRIVLSGEVLAIAAAKEPGHRQQRIYGHDDLHRAWQLDRAGRTHHR
jgi:hypothetical protein